MEEEHILFVLKMQLVMHNNQENTPIQPPYILVQIDPLMKYIRQLKKK